MAGLKGKVVLQAMPDDDVRARVCAFLCRVFKNIPAEKIRKLIERPPVVLTNDLPMEKARMLTARLRKLGAEVRFMPVMLSGPIVRDRAPEPSPPAPGERSEKTAPRPHPKPAAETPKPRPAPLPRPTPAAETPGPRPDPGPRPKTVAGAPGPRPGPGPRPKPAAGARRSRPEPASAKRTDPRGRLTNILLGAALCVTFYAIFFGLPNPLDWFGETEDAAVLQTGTKKKGTPPPGGASPPNGLDKLLSFDKDHSPSYDKRLTAGLTEAFKRYPLFASGKRIVDISVESSVVQLDPHRFNAVFDVNIGGENESYALILSNASRDVDANLDAMAAVFRTFAEQHPGVGAPMESEEDHRPHLSRVSARIADFDYMDMLEALQYIEDRILSDRTGLGVLLGASEVFSWWAFFKNHGPNRTLSDRLGSHAVSCYVMAGVEEVEEAEETDRAYYRGLLLLALGYPDAAEKALGASRPEEEALTAFIRHDVDALDALDLDSEVDRRRLGFLKARALESSGRFNAARGVHQRLIREHPDFLMFREYAANRECFWVGPGEARSYLGDLLAVHLSISKMFTRMDRIKRNRELELGIREGAPTNQWFSRRLSLHGKTVSPANRMKENGILLSGGFLHGFLKADLADALLICFNKETAVPGRLEEADAIANMARNAYPDDALSNVIQLTLLDKHGKGAAMKKLAKAIDVDKAPPHLLQVMLDGVGKRLSNGDDFSMISALLSMYRQKENPDARGLYGLFRWHHAFNYEPRPSGMMEAALEAAPRDYRLYGPMLRGPGGETYAERGRELAGNTYGFLVTLADWRLRADDPDGAVTHYQAAMEMDPGEAAAYLGLGEAYASIGQDLDAIEAWRSYPALGEPTPDAISIQCAIGRTWLALGEYSDARDAFRVGKKSGGCDALIGSAKANERSGKMIPAKKDFLLAADRCPASDAPLELGMHYLRRGKRAAAIDVFRKYGPYHTAVYYHEALIDHFIESGTPGTAVEVVLEVEGEPPDIRVIHALARRFEQKGRRGDALSIHESHMRNMERPKENRPWLFGAGSLNAADGLEGGDPEEILEDLLSVYGRIPWVLESFAVQLIAEERFDDALKALEQKYRADPRRRDVALRMMALAWRLGSRDDDIRDGIADRLETFAQKPWLTKQVRFLFGDLDEEAVLRAANNADRICEIHSILGAVKRGDGDEMGALPHLLIALETRRPMNVERRRAFELLEKTGPWMSPPDGSAKWATH